MAAMGRRGLLPPIRQDGPEAWFEQVSRGPLDIPTVRGELYLEYHRGAYTTDGRGKRLNRACESALLAAETLSAIAWSWGAAWPAADLDDLWKRMLLLQGHDTVAGTVVPESQEEAHRAFEGVLDESRRLSAAATAWLAERIDSGGPLPLGDEAPSRGPLPGPPADTVGRPIVVFNPLSFSRGGAIELEAGPEIRSAVDDRGRPVALQASGGKLVAQVPKVPPLGWSTIFLRESPAPSSPPIRVVEDDDALRVETPHLSAAIDWGTGHLVSLATEGREWLKGEGNVLQLFRDRPPMWDAWNIEAADLRAPIAVLRRAMCVRLVERGPIRAVVLVRKKRGGTVIVQRIVFHADAPRIDFVTEVDWREAHRLLKVSFPVRVDAPRATFEVPFGHVERSTARTTEAERAMFEVPHLRWFDLSDSEGGVSMLNDGRYGCDVEGSTMRLSLLRAPSFPSRRFPSLVGWGRPSRTTDSGRHRFTWSIMPHRGDWRAGGTEREAAALNVPLLAREAKRHSGPLPGRWSLAAVDSEAVCIDAVFVAQEEASLALRLHETWGRPVESALRLAPTVRRAEETDLLEERGRPATPERLAFRPLEIKTLRLAVERHAADEGRG
jgi:alpha-mannosidase